MYIFKNALTNISRNKMRNILLGLIFIVIASILSITFAIKKSASNIVKSYESKNSVEANISMNRDKLMEHLDESDSQEDKINAFNNIESVTLDEIKNYANSVYVSSYYYTYNLRVDAASLTEATDSLVKETTETKTETKSFKNGGPFGNAPPNEQTKTTTKKTEKIYNEKAQDGAFSLTGYSDYASMSEFINGKYKITEGSISEDFESDSCVISSELAEINGLSVGDTITIVDPKNSKKTYKLTITGIYEEQSDSANDLTKMFSDSANTIITNSTVVNKILDGNSSLTATITPTFILTSSDAIEAFTAEVSEKGLSDYYTITTNQEEIEESLSSIKNLENFANTFLIITMIIGGSILVLINTLIIRERKYEIGVLRTIGMKKSLVSLQFVLEIFIVAICSFVIGTGIGSTLSVNVANNLLENEITEQENSNNKVNDNFGNHGKQDFKPNQTIAKVDSIKAVVDIKVITSMLYSLIILTITSSLVAIVSINRFKPLTILKERG